MAGLAFRRFPGGYKLISRRSALAILGQTTPLSKSAPILFNWPTWHRSGPALQKKLIAHLAGHDVVWTVGIEGQR